MVMKRRAKNEALREKIREIKAHQKEVETGDQSVLPFPSRKALFWVLGLTAVAVLCYIKSN